MSSAVEITPSARRRGTLTFEDFLVLVGDGQKADLLDGAIYMASPDNLDANGLTSWLDCILNAFVSDRSAGRVFVSRVAFRLGDAHGPEPDLSFVASARLGLARRGYFLGSPDLAIEIVSPDSVDRDYVLKREIYQQAGVREYWTLDPDARRATFLRLQDGVFVEVLPENHRIASSAIPGFWLDVRWLFQEPRPAPLEVLTQLLGPLTR